MRVDSLLPRIAEHLGIEIVAPLAGGEFGATLVKERGGRRAVLKALPLPDRAERFAAGGALAASLRERGYPAPEYYGTGSCLGASWSLQEFLPGEVPDRFTPAHAHRLCELASMHAGAAGCRGQPRTGDERVWLARVSAVDATAPIAAELGAILDRSSNVELLDDGVVHGDFHHRNYLAEGERITGVFDWEGATVGDWRSDLVSLAYWTAIVVEADAESTGIVRDRGMDACGHDVFAYFAAVCALRHLDFDVRVRPDRVGWALDVIETHVAPWWR